jgi:hypothetical protein
MAPNPEIEPSAFRPADPLAERAGPSRARLRFSCRTARFAPRQFIDGTISAGPNFFSFSKFSALF